MGAIEREAQLVTCGDERSSNGGCSTDEGDCEEAGEGLVELDSERRADRFRRSVQLRPEQ